jgi:hypothetical protein
LNAHEGESPCHASSYSRWEWSSEFSASRVREYPARELPQEWREWKMGVDVDHMYRQKQSPRLDWIREEKGR